MLTNVGKIVKWLDGNPKDIFVHITAFGKVSRAPKPGDVVTVLEFEKNEGRLRIAKAVLEGVPLIASPAKARYSNIPHCYFKCKKTIALILMAVALFLALFSRCQPRDLPYISQSKATTADAKNIAVVENAQYTSRDSVAAYLCKFGTLPKNYVPKSEGISLYERKTGNSFSKWNFNPWITLNVMIGGDEFKNAENQLPPANYREADVDYFANNRGTRRLIYSAGCNIYYSPDHYKSFTLIKF